MAEYSSESQLTEIVRVTKGGQRKSVYLNSNGRYVSEKHKTAAAILNTFITIGERQKTLIMSLINWFKH